MVIEKPFGHDLDSFIELDSNLQVRASQRTSCALLHPFWLFGARFTVRVGRLSCLHPGAFRCCQALLQEQQMFRIDHYLGKEMVQNLMTLRFS